MLGAIIGAGTSILTGGGNAASQAATNAASRRWNEKMFLWQHQANLDDWHRQNQYNSPQEQMSRLKAAGLNPNLVYGEGATTTAGPIKNTGVESWSPVAPKVDLSGLGNSLMQYYDAQVKQAQTDNLKVSTNNAAIEGALKAAQIEQTNAQTRKTLAEAGLGETSLKYSDQLAQISVKAAEASFDKTVQEIASLYDENERRRIMQRETLQKMVAEMALIAEQKAKSEQERVKIRQEIQNLQKDERLKELDINLKKQGVQPGDNIIFRVAAQYWQDIRKTLGF